MEATDNLRSEHKEILKVLNLMENAADKLEAGKAVPAEVFEKAAFFIRDYSDRVHHQKEEDLLFGIMQEVRLPQAVSISVMLTEHDQARFCLKELFAANSQYKKGNREARGNIVKHARQYTQLLYKHIVKEDDELFPMINNVLSKEKNEQLAEKFMETDRAQKPERYLKLINEIQELLDNL